MRRFENTLEQALGAMSAATVNGMAYPSSMICPKHRSWNFDFTFLKESRAGTKILNEEYGFQQYRNGTSTEVAMQHAGAKYCYSLGFAWKWRSLNPLQSALTIVKKGEIQRVTGANGAEEVFVPP